MKKRPQLDFPGGATAALAIIDDAEQGNRRNLEPLYDLLHQAGIVVTKLTWVLPSRLGGDTGDLLQPSYVDWLRKIKSQGFEIALHNVGSGLFTRSEIAQGLELFKSAFGEYPRIHCNHSSNPDNVYWNPSERFAWPVSWAYQIGRFDKRRRYLGTKPNAPCFWGDLLPDKIKYVRNLVFNDINTLKMDPYMPYWDPSRPLVPYWFSSTDMHDIRYFSKVITAENLDRLCDEKGVCIGYTYFGTPGFSENRRPSSLFENVVKILETRRHKIWVAPASTVLDYLLQHCRYFDSELSRMRSLELSLRWVWNRVMHPIS